MVKIRLKRTGNRHRPFYRVVVTKSTAARNGAFKELIGTYDPLTQPKQVKIDKDRAMYWLMEGAQPTETVAYLLKKQGILEEFFSKRPKAKKKYKFLDKTTGTMSKKSVVEEIAVEAPAAPAPATEKKPAEEAAAEAPEEKPAVEAPSETPEEKPVAEEPAAEPEQAKEE
ncbi:MAG: 30S ribosomal protein S16 [Armatimonadetes bacterium]|nr:30S ribosomal protein S16 [Armatimonadota bacterium]